MNYTIANSLTNDILSLCILPTEQCNFRCSYCYESFKLKKMQDETVEAILKLVSLRSSSIKKLNVEWFGGEPLLAQDIVLYLSKKFQELSQKHGFKYKSSMTTNAYLLNKALFQKLLSCGVTSYQISLDGPKEIHDKTRILINKKGTFEKIWKNLLDTKEVDSDFQITIRVHYLQKTLNDIKSFTSTLNTSFGNDKRFVVFYRNVSNLSDCSSENLSIYENHDEIKTIHKDLNELTEGIETMPIEEDDYVCYACKANFFIIRSDASISKCTVCLDEDINLIGKLNTKGELELNQDKARLWSIGLQTEDPDHLICPYYNIIKPEVVDKIKEIS